MRPVPNKCDPIINLFNSTILKKLGKHLLIYMILERKLKCKLLSVSQSAEHRRAPCVVAASFLFVCAQLLGSGFVSL
jgi:hypothetical protein